MRDSSHFYSMFKLLCLFIHVWSAVRISKKKSSCIHQDNLHVYTHVWSEFRYAYMERVVKSVFMYTYTCGQNVSTHTWRVSWRVSSCSTNGGDQTTKISKKFSRESPYISNTFSQVSPVFWRVSSCIRGWSGEAKYTYVDVHIHVNVYMYVYAYTYICMYSYVFICIYPYICTCIYMQNM